jgi:hypothetical protein
MLNVVVIKLFATSLRGVNKLNCEDSIGDIAIKTLTLIHQMR